MTLVHLMVWHCDFIHQLFLILAVPPHEDGQAELAYRSCLSTYHLHTEMVCLWCVNISSNWTAHTATTLIKTKALPLNKSASFVYQNRYLLSSKMYAIQFISRKMQLLSNRSHRKILQVPINSYKCYYKNTTD